MQPITIQFAVRYGYVMISGGNNRPIMQIDMPHCSTLPLAHSLSVRCLGYSAPIRLIASNKIDKMDSKIGFEMSLFVVKALRGRCASFMILTATV